MKKRILALIAMVLCLAMLTACGGGATGGNEGGENQPAASGEMKSMKIGFATNSVGEAFVQMKKAFDEEIGPALNIEFMYSEEIKDAGALTTFIENAYAAGCDGIICNYSNSNDQGAALCNDLGMYFVGIASADPKENTTMPYYVSTTGASAAGYGESYADAINAIVGDGEEHSIIILTGAACYGATSAIEGSAGTLRALQDIYGLTYDVSPDELALVSVQTEATNDKGVKITIVPGMQDLATVVSPLLQTGEYDVVVGTNDVYSNLNVAISEVETALGMNIKMVSKNAFSDTIGKAINSTDSTGAQTVDGVVCDGTFERIAAVIVLRNAFDGYAEQMRNGENCSRIPGMRPLVVTTAEEYNFLAGSEIPYSFVTVEDVLSLCCAKNPEITWADIDAFGANLTTENIMAKFG